MMLLGLSEALAGFGGETDLHEALGQRGVLEYGRGGRPKAGARGGPMRFTRVSAFVMVAVLGLASLAQAQGMQETAVEELYTQLAQRTSVTLFAQPVTTLAGIEVIGATERDVTIGVGTRFGERDVKELPSISRAPMFDPILPMPAIPMCIRRGPFS